LVETQFKTLGPPGAMVACPGRDSAHGYLRTGNLNLFS
jgi:hypothetical protein